MNKPLAILAAFLLSACAERHYMLEAPPPSHAEPYGPHAPAVSRPARVSDGALPYVGSAGPLKVAMVESYMDAQERDFRAHLHASGVVIARIGDDLVLSLNDSVLFSDNELSDRGRDTLERLAELLRHYDHTAITVGGYTDTSEAADRSLQVTQARAKTVAGALVSDGVAGARVTSQGYGSAHLKIATGAGKKESRNRRIEIRIIAHPTA